MSKKETYREELAQRFADYRTTGDADAIMEYLLAQSNLPGPRGNLELAAVFAELAAERFVDEPEQIWSLCETLIGLSAEEAPVNDPKEFLPFCGAQAIGAIGAVSAAYFQEAMVHLRELANDPRWRIREGVAMGIQRLLAKENQKTLAALEAWIAPGAWLALRTVAAGVAEPPLLRDEQTARAALALHVQMLNHVRMAATQERKSDEFKALKKGLGYSLSVVVAALPLEGFAYLQQLADSTDREVQWILKENMKKARLTKHFPEEVAALQERRG
jgi:hypothetical protein